MGVNRVKERVAGQAINATSASSRIIDVCVAVAPDDVIPGISGVGGIEDSKLRVVEDIECFCSKFQVSFAEDLEMLQKRQVEICPARIWHGGAAAITECQSPRSDKSCWAI